jgi:hypothetical protein
VIMKEFITLEEFLTTQYDINGRTLSRSSSSWLYAYRLAKASFEQFGENGPPVGAKVITLVKGHGGNGCDIRKFDGEYNERFFKILGDQDRVSLVSKATWWSEIVSLDPVTVGWGELPKFIFKRPSWCEVHCLVRHIMYN